MADYFTHFSCLLDVGSPENAARALDLYNALARENAGEDPSSDAFMLSIQPEHGGTQLWMRDDGTGDPEHVIQFVKRCAAAFGLTGLWGMQYALCRIRHKAYYPGCRIMPRGLRPPANINFPSDPDSQVLQAVVQLTFNPNPSVSP